MKIRVYDYGSNTELGCPRYTMYLPYPKQLQSETKMKAWGFGFNCNTNYNNFFLRYETLEFPNGMYGVNLGKRVNIADLPKFMQDYIIRLEKAFNEACKFNDDEHWKTFRIVLNNI